jgi:uncharacterized protein YecT (DUF1311 family)
MIRFLPALTLCTAILPVAAVAGDCTDASTTMEMRICAAEELKRADALLNAAYRDTKAAAAEADVLHGEAAESGAVHHLREAQRAWIKLRDADCALAGFPFRGGTMEPLLVTSCLTELTETRTEDLKYIAQTLRH